MEFVPELSAGFQGFMPGFFFVLIMIKKNLLMYFWNTLFLTIATVKNGRFKQRSR
jgi:hypothetical protein